MPQRIGPKEFDQELTQTPGPVLLACLSAGPADGEQLQGLARLERALGDKVKVYLLDEQYLEFFRARYSVEGMPTFLLFQHGREKDRLLGRQSASVLESFVLGVTDSKRADDRMRAARRRGHR